MSKIKAAETIRPVLEVRMRLSGITPPQQPIPEPDMRIADPKRREKAHTKARVAAEHANTAAMARALDTARAPWFGCTAGRAIATVPSIDVPKLWEAIQRVRSVYARYLSAISAPDPNAKGMNLELMPEEFGSDGVEVDGGWDDRSEEERVQDATRAMMHMEQTLGMAGYGVLAEVKSVVLRDERVCNVGLLVLGLAAVARDA